MSKLGTPSEKNGRPPLFHRSVSSIPSVPSMQSFVAGVEKTISYTLHDPSHGPGHRLGVLSIAMNRTGDTLLTGGRDGAVIEWDTSASLPQPQSRATYNYHTNWVNDLFLTHNDKHCM
jgi:WD40 repeat protein